MKQGKLLMVLALALTLVGGCANIQDDGTRTKAEGAGTGAAVGAVLGAVIGQVIGGDTEATLLGAAIGGAIGGAGGYAYGSHVAGQKEQYAKEEDWLDACISEAKTSNATLVAYNAELSKQIATLRSEAETLQKQEQNAKGRRTKLAKKQAETEELLQHAKEELAASQAGLAAQEEVVAQARQDGMADYATTLDSELETLKANIRELEKRTEELASISASMAV
jgi:hypothetical protein